MGSVRLFKGQDNHWVTDSELLDSLAELGAAECELLVVQTGTEFGMPVPELGRKAYLSELYQVLCKLNVPTMAVPVFSYSFCNHEDYDVRNSKTHMGALAEFIRKRPEAKRSMDPLLSMVVIGEKQDIFDGDLGTNSLGAGCAFDRIHHTKNVKFLCYGSDFSNYFTYVHYVEKMLEVPYRFDMGFHGKIIDEQGNVTEDTHYIHTACGGVIPSAFPYLRDTMVEKGTMQTKKLGDTELVCVSEENVYQEIVEQLKNNINYFLAKPFTQNDLTHEYQYGKNGERVTHC